MKGPGDHLLSQVIKVSTTRMSHNVMYLLVKALRRELHVCYFRSRPIIPVSSRGKYQTMQIVCIFGQSPHDGQGHERKDKTEKLVVGN